MKIISVFESFSEFPALRHCNISEKSGEEFYHTVLNREFKEQYEKGETLTVNLETVYGIIFAILIWPETEHMTKYFYIGATMILSVIILNAIVKSKIENSNKINEQPLL